MFVLVNVYMGIIFDDGVADFLNDIIITVSRWCTVNTLSLSIFLVTDFYRYFF